MKREEFEVRMKYLTDLLKTEGYTEERFNEIGELQMEYMTGVLAEYEKTINGDEAKQECYDILHYAVHQSESGSSVGYVSSEELADRIDEIIVDEIGEYMLDAPEIYQEANGDWVIDCMFAGMYVPYWDGYKETWWYEEVSA